MMHSVSLPPDLYQLLEQRAQRSHVSPDALAEEALRHYFNQEEQNWQQAFTSLIGKVQSRAVNFSAEEIEADTSAATMEVEEMRRARCCFG